MSFDSIDFSGDMITELRSEISALRLKLDEANELIEDLRNGEIVYSLAWRGARAQLAAAKKERDEARRLAEEWEDCCRKYAYEFGDLENSPCPPATCPWRVGAHSASFVKKPAELPWEGEK